MSTPVEITIRFESYGEYEDWSLRQLEQNKCETVLRKLITELRESIGTDASLKHSPAHYLSRIHALCSKETLALIDF